MPIHIHVEKADCYSKLWIEPLFVAANNGFNSKELREISIIIEENENHIYEKWNEYFAK